MALQGQASGAMTTDQSVKQAAMTPAQQHALDLSDIGSSIYDLRIRLANFVARVNGPQGEAVDAAEPPTPQGVLGVAMFEAQRIRTEVERVRALIGELEQIA